MSIAFNSIFAKKNTNMEFNPSENLKDIGSAVQDVVKEKFKYAIVVSYTIVWLIFNWDLVYFILFSNDNAVNKIKYINDNFLNYNWLMTFVYFMRNLIVASVLTFVFPVIQVLLNLLSRSFYKMDLETENIKKGANLIRDYQQQQDILKRKIKQIEMIENEFEDLKNKNNELDLINSEIEDLKKENIELRKDNIRLKLNNNPNKISGFDLATRE